MGLLQKNRMPAPSAVEIAEKIVAAQDTYAKLQIRQGELAVASVTDPEAERQYAEVTDTMVATDSEIRRLQQAAEALEKQVAAALRERQGRERAALRQRIGSILEARDEAGKKLEEKLGDALAAFRELCTLSDKARACFPGTAIGAQLGRADIVNLTSFEIYRIGGNPPETGGAVFDPSKPSNFPGGRAPGFEFVGTPSAIKPLSVAISEGSSMVLAALENGNG